MQHLVRDVIGEIARANGDAPDADDVPLERLRRDILFVPPSMPLPDLLVKMQASRTHLALVVDEYGGTDGLVTIEDLIEPIVGDIEDEHDELEEELKKVVLESGEVCWDADARMSIDDFEEAIERDFATIDEEEEVDTLGGLVFTLAGRVPGRGEIIVHPEGVEMEVIDADPRRVKRLRITLPDQDNSDTTAKEP